MVTKVSSLRVFKFRNKNQSSDIILLILFELSNSNQVLYYYN
jgi:hypothetical protein